MAEAIEFFFIGLVAAFDLAIEARGARRDEAVAGTEALAHSRKGVDLYGSIQGGFGASGIPVGEDGVVVRLNDLDGEGEGGEGVLDKGFGGVGGHFFVELDDAQAGAAVDGGELEESSAFHEVGDEFNIDLEEVSWVRDGKGSAVAFGVGFTFAGQAVAFEDFAEGEGGRDLFEAVVEEELAEAEGSQVGCFAEGEDAAAEGFFDAVVGVVGSAGLIEKGRAISFGLAKTFFPFIEGISGDS